MVIPARVWLPWSITALCIIVAAAAVSWANFRALDAINIAAAAQASAMRSAGAVTAKDVPAPPVPLPLRNQVDAIRRAVPEAKPSRSADVQTVWIEAQGPVLPCAQPAPSISSPGAGPGTTRTPTSVPPPGGALLRPGDRFRIHLVSVDLTTPQGATGTVGEGELLRFDGSSLGRGPLDQDASTVWRRQRPQERPRWFAVPMAGVTSRARAWAGVAIGRGRWGGVLGAAWKPGAAEYFGGVAFRW